MSDEKALLAAIWEHPHEDTPRLVFADWLQEHGQPERAEFIRVQCELARLDENDARNDDLQKQEARIWKKYGRTWKEGLPPNVRCNRFERGFPTNRNVGIPARRFLKLRAADLAPVPLWDYYLTKAEPVWKQLLSSPNLSRLLALQTSLSFCGPEPVRQLAASPYTRNLAKLSLSFWVTGTEGLNALLGADLPNLRKLDLGHNQLGDEGAVRLAAGPLPPRLEHLDLSGNEIGSDGFMAVMRALGPRRMTRLDLSDNPVGNRGVALLTQWSGAGDLRTLLLYSTQLSDAAAVELAGCPALAELRELYLGWNRIGLKGAQALAKSPHLSGLTALYLNDNPLGDNSRAVATLRARFGEAVHF
jgi:uncharacterized protein (TIGR02996 family)